MKSQRIVPLTKLVSQSLDHLTPKMKVCVIQISKRFGTQRVKGFYEIQNNCIVAHYFVGNTKLDYFANLGDLDISVNESGLPVLIDRINGIQIQLKCKLRQAHSQYEIVLNSHLLISVILNVFKANLLSCQYLVVMLPVSHKGINVINMQSSDIKCIWFWI
ncbi:Hypothetical_protein [Hexamita inflata]|uniref:Hypothetical_protein n=1 Tax=Hexamita inflata TaxID=28002 RepID=A0AA86S651_9EUKA|nr:Hypothetical protein HINF_LOCUS66415 [Hexamita inflata]